MASTDLISLFVIPLNDAGVKYMITGSVASSIYGYARMTDDIDLVITLSAADAVALHRAFDPNAFYVPPIEVIEAERRRPAHGHFNMIHSESGFKADVYLQGQDLWSHEALAGRRQDITPSSVPIWIAPPEYVIVNKLRYLRDSGSKKHITDIRAMLEVQGQNIDQTRLQSGIQTFRLDAQWQQVWRGDNPPPAPSRGREGEP